MGRKLEFDLNFQSEMNSLKQKMNELSNSMRSGGQSSVSGGIRQQAQTLVDQQNTQLGRELLYHARVPSSQVGGVETRQTGEKFAPDLIKAFKKMDDLASSGEDLADAFEDLLDVLKEVKQAHKEREHQLRQESQSRQTAFASGAGLVSSLERLQRGDIMGAGMGLVGSARGLASAAGNIGGLGAGVLGALAVAGTLATAGVSQFIGSQQSSFQQGLAGQQLRGMAGIGLPSEKLHGLSLLSPFVGRIKGDRFSMLTNNGGFPFGIPGIGPGIKHDSEEWGGIAYKYGVMPGVPIGGISSLLKSGGGFKGGLSFGGMEQVAEKMLQVHTVFGTNVNEFGKTLGLMQRWAKLTPEEISKAIDEGVELAVKSGNRGMFEEIMATTSSMVNQIAPSLFDPMQGNALRASIQQFQGMASKYGYPGSAAQGVYSGISQGIGAGLFNKQKAAFLYSLGMTQEQMVDSESPESVMAFVTGLKNMKGKGVFGAGDTYSRMALKMFGLQGATAFSSRVLEDKTSSMVADGGESSLKRMSDQMLKQDYFKTQQKRIQAELTALNNNLSASAASTNQVWSGIKMDTQTITAGMLAYLGKIGVADVSDDAMDYAQRLFNKNSEAYEFAEKNKRAGERASGILKAGQQSPMGQPSSNFQHQNVIKNTVNIISAGKNVKQETSEIPIPQTGSSPTSTYLNIRN